MIPYWGVYLKSLGYSSRDVGIISAIVLATRIVAPNFWGWLADRSQQRLRIIRVGSACAAAIFAGVFISSQYSWLVLVVSLYTFFWHAVLPQFEVITLSYLVGQHHKYGRIRLWGSLGFMAAVVGLGWLFDWLSVNTLPIAIFTFLTLIWLSSISLQDRSQSKQHGKSNEFIKLVMHPTMLCFLAGSFLLQLSHGPYYTFYSLYLTENYGYSSTATGLLWALGVLAEVVIFIVMPKIMRRFTLRDLLLISFAVTAIRWLLIGYAAQWLWILLFAQLLHAFSFGTAHAASIEVVRTWFKSTNQGQGQALYSSFSFGAGGATGALVGAFLWDHSASLTFLIASISIFIGFLIAWFGLHLKVDPATK